jgi:hypothetical protein
LVVSLFCGSPTGCFIPKAAGQELYLYCIYPTIFKE